MSRETIGNLTGPVCEFTQKNLSLAAVQGKTLLLENGWVVAPSRFIAEKIMLESFANARASTSRDIDVTCVNISPVVDWLANAARGEIEALALGVPLTLPFPRAVVGYTEKVSNGVCDAWRFCVLLLTRTNDGSSIDVIDLHLDGFNFVRSRIHLTEGGLIGHWANNVGIQNDPKLPHLVCCALAMFHVRNIGLHPVPLPRYLRKKLKNESGVEGPQVYHTLVLRPFSQSGKDDQARMLTGDRPLHLVRGHFAHYTKQRPLFGKYEGTFWRPEHEAGNKAIAVVRKTFGFNLDEEAS